MSLEHTIDNKNNEHVVLKRLIANACTMIELLPNKANSHHFAC